MEDDFTAVPPPKEYLYEILVPESDNDGERFSVEHHQAWDRKVIDLAGGQTIMKPAEGRWISPKKELFKERMIPVRIFCTEERMMEIIAFTMVHYDQLAVMAYVISDHVLLIHREELHGPGFGDQGLGYDGFAT